MKKKKNKSVHEAHFVPNPHKPDYVPESRDKMGKLAEEARAKDTDPIDVRDMGGEMTKNYMAELFITLENGKKNYKKDFFIVVLTKREPTMINVIRNFFLHRASCPTPNYDQAVYHYMKEDNKLDLLWVIPDREFCFFVKDNILTLDSDLKELSQFVLDYADGTLMALAKKLNNEDVLEGSVIMEIIKEGNDANIQ